MELSKSNASEQLVNNQDGPFHMAVILKKMNQQLVELVRAKNADENKIDVLAQSVIELNQKVDTLIDLMKVDKQNPENIESRKVIPGFVKNLQYEIGCEGSGIFVNEIKWFRIKSAKTPTQMATTLVRELFSQETLLRSNLKGGKSKINRRKKGDDQKFDPLDPVILKTIYDHVRRYFSDDFSNSNIGKSINQMLVNYRKEHGQSRKAKKNKNAAAEKQSSSSDSD